jgi:hypothetical protein
LYLPAARGRMGRHWRLVEDDLPAPVTREPIRN